MLMTCEASVRADAQTTVSVVFRMLTLLMYEPERGVIWRRGTRFFTLHQLAAATLEPGFVEATALLIKCANYGIGAPHSTPLYSTNTLDARCS